MGRRDDALNSPGGDAQRATGAAGETGETGEAIELRTQEIRLLWVLMTNVGAVLRLADLAARVLQVPPERADLVRPHIRRLREKIEPDPNHPRYIVTITGVGYTFMPQGPRPETEPSKENDG